MTVITLYNSLWRGIVESCGQWVCLKSGVDLGIMMLFSLSIPFFIVWLLNPIIFSRKDGASFKGLVYFASSLGLAGIIVVYLGIFKANNTTYLMVVLAFLGIIAFFIRVRVSGQFNVVGECDQRNQTVEVLVVAIFLLLVGPFVFYHAASFPILIWDALTHNAPVARNLYLYGGFPDFTGVSAGAGMSTGYPPLHESIGAYFYTFVNWDNDIFLRILSPISWLLLIWACYELGKEMGGPRLGAVAASLLIFTPVVVFAGIVATQYVLLGFLVTLMLIFIVRLERTRDIRDCLMAGWFMGLAGLVSYNTYYLIIAVLVAGAILIICDFVKRGIGQLRLSVKMFLLIFLVAGVLNLPWWLRNYVVFNTPIQPFLSSNEVIKQYNLLRIDQMIFYVQGNSVMTGSPSLWFDFFFWRADLFPIASFFTLFGMLGFYILKRRFLFVVAFVILFWLSPVVQPGHHNRVIIVYSTALALLVALPVWFMIRRAGRTVFAVVLLMSGGILMANVVNVLAYGSAYVPHSRYRYVSSEWAWDSENKLPGVAYQAYYDNIYPSVKFVNDNLLLGKNVALGGIAVPSYLIAGGDLGRIVFLDTPEVVNLLSSGSPVDLVKYLKDHNVQYVLGFFGELDVYWQSRINLRTYIGEALTWAYPEVWFVSE